MTEGIFDIKDSYRLQHYMDVLKATQLKKRKKSPLAQKARLQVWKHNTAGEKTLLWLRINAATTTQSVVIFPAHKAHGKAL